MGRKLPGCAWRAASSSSSSDLLSLLAGLWLLLAGSGSASSNLLPLLAGLWLLLPLSDPASWVVLAASWVVLAASSAFDPRESKWLWKDLKKFITFQAVGSAKRSFYFATVIRRN